MEETKIRFFEAVVFTTLLCDSETREPTIVKSTSSSSVSAPSSTFIGVTSSQTLKFWSRPRSPELMYLCLLYLVLHPVGFVRNTEPLNQQWEMDCCLNIQIFCPFPMFSFIWTVDCSISLREKRPMLQRLSHTTPHCMLTTYAGQTWQLTVMPLVTRSLSRLTDQQINNNNGYF